jgi:IS30 family transposase
VAKKMEILPEFLRKSITWDQDKEMATHAQFTVKTGIEVYFRDPHLVAWRQREHQRSAPPVFPERD